MFCVLLQCSRAAIRSWSWWSTPAGESCTTTSRRGGGCQNRRPGASSGKSPPLSTTVTRYTHAHARTRTHAHTCKNISGILEFSIREPHVGTCWIACWGFQLCTAPLNPLNPNPNTAEKLDSSFSDRSGLRANYPLTVFHSHTLTHITNM